MRTSGWVLFASLMLVLAGIFGIIDGLVAIINNEVYVVTEDAIIGLDFTMWGVIHLAVGTVVLAAGLSVVSGAPWARAIGIVAAMMGAISQIWFITAFPLWSISIIALDVLVIYGLVVHGEEVEAP